MSPAAFPHSGTLSVVVAVVVVVVVVVVVSRGGDIGWRWGGVG